MSRDLEIRANGDFNKLAATYVKYFAHSYAKFEQGPVDFSEELLIYKQVIEERRAEIYRAAAFGLSGYTNKYRVFPRNGFDAFKLIYFLGKAIHAQLADRGHLRLAQIHLFTLIALMDTALNRKGVVKPQLTAALTHLVRYNHFWSELGETGAYLIYKTCSTVECETCKDKDET